MNRLAYLAGRQLPRSVDDLESVLSENNAMPSLDLVGFYSQNDPFLTKRYFDKSLAPPGLVTFFLRDFGRGLADVEAVREQLKTVFEIHAEGPISDAMRAAVGRGVRGGNWTDAEAIAGSAEPVYWFVWIGMSPESPSAER